MCLFPWDVGLETDHGLGGLTGNTREWNYLGDSRLSELRRVGAGQFSQPLSALICPFRFTDVAFGTAQNHVTVDWTLRY